DVKLQMPIWKHPGMKKDLYQRACRRDSATCLRQKHGVQLVSDAREIAARCTTVARKPHQVNPPGIGRKNCGCPSCYQDRTVLGCDHPGQCVETAKMLINSILPKWNPDMPNGDLCDDLALTDEEHALNGRPLQADQIMIFDPNFSFRRFPNFCFRRLNEWHTSTKV
ncbi:hypothetical protein C8R45DRAFT_834689, partial [Mycena sanguinolenta]